jgi:hypothetical protein
MRLERNAMNKIDNVQYFCCKCDHRPASDCCGCEQTGALMGLRTAIMGLQDAVFARLSME